MAITLYWCPLTRAVRALWLRDGLARGPWILGDAFSAADVLIGSMIQWGVATKLLPDDDVFGGYVKRLASRPALQRTLAIEAAG